MIFDKVETKNLLNMLRSSDTENATLAFEALKGVDIQKIFRGTNCIIQVW
jgi:hypothetical protein